MVGGKNGAPAKLVTPLSCILCPGFVGSSLTGCTMPPLFLVGWYLQAQAKPAGGTTINIGRRECTGNPIAMVGSSIFAVYSSIASQAV